MYEVLEKAGLLVLLGLSPEKRKVSFWEPVGTAGQGCVCMAYARNAGRH